MKRILGLLTVLLFINACDDGDLTVDTINFDDVTVQKCTEKDILYKISGPKMLILAIPDETFANNETPDNDPIEIEIGGDIELIYRQYNAEPSSHNVCDLITAATPNLIEEWNAISGTIVITTNAITSVNQTTGITQITGYQHYIVVQNLVFERPDGTTQNYSGVDFVFGNYNESVSPLAFGFDELADKSTCDDRIFNLNSSEAFVLDLADYATLFQNAETTTPRIAYISATNKVNYLLYTGTVDDEILCTVPAPATPTISQNWAANNGDEANGTGKIEVTTIESSPGFFQHTIHLKKVTMTQGNTSFYLGDDYIYGSFITP
ncbi:hypothetical protein [Flavobacterium terrisoli]|uniref:hypothetical protein n=1 Tax=Flavobacterium terrisoli TaxID=3242195 RepID=UPI002543BD45|nr:hypothetical protein [Flavobacterium buctense]